MAATVAASSHLLFSSTSQSITHLSSLRTISSCSKNVSSFFRRTLQQPPSVDGSVKCMAVTAEKETKKKSGYELYTLTSWLLKQEQAGAFDAELTIVLSSISMACKQIASLVQRASISNLTGVQGEDEKKLDVVSNRVHLFLPF